MKSEFNEYGIRFSGRQATIITTAISACAFAVLAVIVCALAWFALRFVSAYSTVLLPPIAAVILAQVVRPLFEAFRKGIWLVLPARFREKAKRSAHGIVTGTAIVLVLVVLFVPLIIFLRYFGALVFHQLVALVEKIPGFVSGLWDKAPEFKAYLEEHGLLPFVQKLDPASWFDVAAVAESVKNRAFAIAGGVPALFNAISGWLMVPVYLVLYLATRPFEGGDITRAFLGVSEHTRHNIGFLFDEFIRIVVGFFRGQVLVALIEGALFGLGFQFLAGLPYGLLLGILVGIVNIIPYMGSIFVMPFVCLFAFFGAGGWSTLLIVVAVWAGVGLADFYITPKVQGNQTGLSTFAVIFSLLFWGAVLDGFVGLFLAVPLSAFIVVLWRFLRKEYFPPAGKSAPPPAPTAPPADSK